MLCDKTVIFVSSIVDGGDVVVFEYDEVVALLNVLAIVESIDVSVDVTVISADKVML